MLLPLYTCLCVCARVWVSVSLSCRPARRCFSDLTYMRAQNDAHLQASSIQSIGSTLESVTIGHTPSKMGLSADAVFLKGKRKDFYCEVAIKQELKRKDLDDRSAGMLLGDYHNMRKRCLGIVDEETDDVMEQLAMVKKVRCFQLAPSS